MSEDTILIRQANIYDGVDNDGHVGDVLIEQSRITHCETRLDPPAGVTVVDAAGYDLLPGFIDVHSHDDAALFADGALQPKLKQGVTTTVIGNCGHGCAPSIGGPALERYSTPILGQFPAHKWPTFTDFVQQLVREQLEVNVGVLAPHTPIRAAVMGMERRRASQTEIDAISSCIGEALEAGASGASLGLMYSPGNSAGTDELTAIARAVAKADGLLVAHLRNEADHLLASLEEFADLGRATGAALHVSHLKITGPNNFGAMPRVIEQLDSLRREGIDISADVYPYEAGSTTAATLMPPWAMDHGLPHLLAELSRPDYRRRVAQALEGPWLGGLENYYHSLGPSKIVLAGFRQPHNQPLDGMTLSDIAARREANPIATLLDLLLDEDGNIMTVLFQTDPEGIAQALAWPHTLVGSDGLPHASGYVHPRLYGTFPRVLTSYAGPGHVLTRPEAIRRMTSASAERFGFSRKGHIQPGYDADLQLISPSTYRDRASFTSPRRSPAGLKAVLVNGSQVDCARPGRVILSHSDRAV